VGHASSSFREIEIGWHRLDLWGSCPGELNARGLDALDGSAGDEQNYYFRWRRDVDQPSIRDDAAQRPATARRHLQPALSREIAGGSQGPGPLAGLRIWIGTPRGSCLQATCR
jgi:hypothetical protein